MAFRSGTLMLTRIATVGSGMVAGRALYVPSMECQGRAVSTEAKKGPTVAVCQLNVDIDPSLTPMANRANNLANAKAAIEKAHEETGADIVVLGECFNCPYDVTQFQPYSEPIPTNMRDIVPESHPSTSMLSGVAKELGIYLIGGSFPGKWAMVIWPDTDNFDRAAKWESVQHLGGLLTRGRIDRQARQGPLV